jgi:hypothetical protein
MVDRSLRVQQGALWLPDIFLCLWYHPPGDARAVEQVPEAPAPNETAGSSHRGQARPVPGSEDTMTDVHDTEKEREHRLEHLMDLRMGLFEELEELDHQMVTLRTRIERMESDMRLGEPEPEGYGRLKGHDFPGLEARYLQTYSNLQKLEEKILFTKMSHHA